MPPSAKRYKRQAVWCAGRHWVSASSLMVRVGSGWQDVSCILRLLTSDGTWVCTAGARRRVQTAPWPDCAACVRAGRPCKVGWRRTSGVVTRRPCQPSPWANKCDMSCPASLAFEVHMVFHPEGRDAKRAVKCRRNTRALPTGAHVQGLPTCFVSCGGAQDDVSETT